MNTKSCILTTMLSIRCKIQVPIDLEKWVDINDVIRLAVEEGYFEALLSSSKDDLPIEEILRTALMKLYPETEDRIMDYLVENCGFVLEQVLHVLKYVDAGTKLGYVDGGVMMVKDND